MDVKQMAMFRPPVAAQDLRDLSPLQKAELLLDENPQARNDDRLLMLLWWERFDDLGTMFHWTLRDLLEGEVGDEELQVMAEAATERFRKWFLTATHPETIRRRRAELQSNRKKHGALRGSAQTTAYRKARDGAGPPRR